MLILDKLWNGKIRPCERYVLENSPYAKLTHESVELMHTLRAAMSPELKQQYDTYCDMQMELEKISEEDAFIQGFRLGVRLLLDVMGEYHSQLPTERVSS